MEDRKAIAILGPTGSGKSELALSVAARFAGEVVNCDSLQVYRYFDVGTAKLPPEARQGIAHHLIDILDPDQVFTAGDYANTWAASSWTRFRRAGICPWWLVVRVFTSAP